LALVAFGTHAAARNFLMDAMHRKAGNIEQAVHQKAEGNEQAQNQAITYKPDSQTLASTRNSNVLTTVGIVLTALSVVCMVTALMRREPGWYLLLILLLVFDLGAPMLL
jgi:hypothetical protein